MAVTHQPTKNVLSPFFLYSHFLRYIIKHLPEESLQKLQQVQQEPKTSYTCYYHLIQRILQNIYYRAKRSEAST